MAYDDLISKLRSNIDNGFSIGSGNRYSLADMGNPGFAQGGPIPEEMMMAPPPQTPAPGDDTIISAKTGEFVFPEDVVKFLGIDRLNKMIVDAKKRMGELSKQPGEGYALGGPVQEDPMMKPHSTITDFMAKQQQPQGIPGLADASRIGVTMNDGKGIVPVYDANSANPTTGAPLSSLQADSLHDSWGIKPLDQLTDKDRQYMGNIPISIGATEGIYKNLANVTNTAIADSINKGNAGLEMPATNDHGEQNAWYQLRGSLGRADSQEAVAWLRAEMQGQMSEDRLKGQLEAARIRGDSAVQAATIRALNKVASGNGSSSPLAQSTFVDPTSGKPLVYDKRTGTYKIATVEGGSVAPKPGAVTPENAAKSQLIEQATSYMPQIKGFYLNKDGVVDRNNVFNATTRMPLSQGRQASTLILDAMEAKLRAESGAAVPEPEVKRMAKRYMPSPLDDDKTIKMKLDNLGAYLSGASAKMNRGKGTGQSGSRTVVRTGMLNGKRVVQYSDGSVEHGK